ncbi:DUF2288 domain-containing protein [Halopseudomonas aestusnigri]|uniref:DUF2288 domain-containing protein n=1 Tax=Halopseudomonas aestusnigri TaxID=857252 RepID=UPI001E4AF24B|nr:DUF2288 domain-containing protein [Halopseudomonas aestusnigri]UGV29544.1 DUF2288 domain-containing protein [Halopseudomonas aestusnigri]
MTVSDEAYAAILGATAQIEWKVLEPHFARGDLLAVDAALDLVQVASAMMEDNSEAIKGWMDAGQLQVATDSCAADWAERNPDTLWAVVIRPWVLVQERTG